MKVCGVSFKENGKVYDFDCSNQNYDIGSYVIVATEKGEQLGKVVFVYDKEVKNGLKPVIKQATDKDYKKYLENLKLSSDALEYAKNQVKEMNLNMQIIDASFTFDKKQLLYNFISDERVDFREFAKVLAGKYKTRIELHQIGVRDKAKEIGGLGICGRELCCKKYLQHMDTISINMAKNQNIALNPSKINGGCCRLLCCLAFEDDNYQELKKDLPVIGKTIIIDNKKGKVISVDILSQSYKVDFDGNIEEVFLNEKKCYK